MLKHSATHKKYISKVQKKSSAILQCFLSTTLSAILISALVPPEAHGVHLYALNDLKAIQAEISRQGLTRIRVQEDRIRNVFGVTGEYVLETDEDQGQIFIRPIGAGSLNPISLTFTTEKGHTQDLLLTPTDKTPEALILTSIEASENQKTVSSLPSLGEIEKLIIACREQRIPVGYSLMPLDLKTLNGPYHLIREISNGRLRGRTYEISNISEKSLPLSEEELAQDSRTIAVLITKRTLNPGERTHVYVVSKVHP